MDESLITIARSLSLYAALVLLPGWAWDVWGAVRVFAGGR